MALAALLLVAGASALFRSPSPLMQQGGADRWTPGDAGTFRRALPKRRGKAKRTERKVPAAGRGFGKDIGGLKYTRQPAPDAPCGCGSGQSYGGCCAELHAAGAADDALGLLRARYTAYRYRQPAFLIATTAHDSPEWRADEAKWTRELLEQCDRFVFERLRVLREPELVGETATATFAVSLVEKGSIRMFRAVETSEYVLEDGHWLYRDGEVRYEVDEEDEGGAAVPPA